MLYDEARKMISEAHWGLREGPLHFLHKLVAGQLPVENMQDVSPCYVTFRRK